MAKKTGFFLPAISAVVLLGVALALALVLPLPEDVAFKELSEIEIAAIAVTEVTPQAAVDELNAQIQETSRTRYRIFLAPSANRSGTVSFDFGGIPVTECAVYIAELSGNKVASTPEGVVIDHIRVADRHHLQTWRSKLQHWVLFRLPAAWQRWIEPDRVDDPFAPAR
ncbi:MAG: hypothetical protein ACAH88_17145 [Roseimicrobium sp.]